MAIFTKKRNPGVDNARQQFATSLDTITAYFLKEKEPVKIPISEKWQSLTKEVSCKQITFNIPVNPLVFIIQGKVLGEVAEHSTTFRRIFTVIKGAYKNNISNRIIKETEHEIVEAHEVCAYTLLEESIIIMTIENESSTNEAGR